VLWTTFSLIYYGVPFPNTAYAKMLHGLPAAEMSNMGLSYLVVSFKHDLFATMIVLLLTLRVVVRRELPMLVLWLGLALNLAYVAYIGGDFMKGRFVSIPVLYSALALMSNRERDSGPREEQAMPTPLQWIWVLLLIILTAVSSTPVKLSPRSGFDLEKERVQYFPNRVVDERDFYFKTNSLWAFWRRDANAPFPDHTTCRLGIDESAKDADISRFRGIGMFGYCADLNLRIVDRLGIADPFLARLPVPAEASWRAGHFTRVLPPGYWGSRQRGRNLIPNEHLAALLTDVMLQTRGPLFTQDRWRALWRLNTRHHDDIGPHYFASLEVARSKAENPRDLTRP
jgi:arabinofuranosyltransferase